MAETERATVMVVDDTPTNLRLLTLLLQNSVYDVVTHTRGRDALSAAAEKPPDIVLLDVSMPEMDGYEVCRHLKATDHLRDIPVLFISAHSEAEEKVKAFEVGGVDYITKPFHVAEVKARVGTHLTVARLQARLQQQNQDLERMVAEKVEEVYSAQLSMIVALARLAEHRDNDTGRHLERVQRYTKLLAEQLHHESAWESTMSEEFILNLYHATPLHDIGKVSIPDRILLKPGRLDPDEFEVMKTHAAVGAETLQSVRAEYQNNAFLSVGLAITRSHHERWDGAGYPDGISEDAIPSAARIMAVADVYDALRSKRVYKPAFSHNEAMQIIREGAGTQFDPTVVQALDRIETEFERVGDTVL